MDGRYQGEIETEWPETGLPLLYRQPIGGGYASFVIADGTAFTIEQRRDEEVAAAYDLETGREVWTRGWGADFRETLGGDGPRATPTWDEGRLFVLGAEGHLEALAAATGEILWERNVLEDAGAENLTWGMSASPLIVDEKVIVLPGGNGSSVAAYRKDTGDVLWKSLDDTQAYTSPMLVTLAGEPQVLVVGARRAMGVSVDDGRLLWDHPWVTNQGINVMTLHSMLARPTKLVVLAAAVTASAAAAFLYLNTSEPVGRISRADMREIQGVIASRLVPWSSFTLRNLRFWPTLIRTRWSLRITRILDDNSSIGRMTIRSDGTTERSSFPSLIEYKGYGSQGVFPVIRKNGHWQIDDSFRGKEMVFLFPYFNHPACRQGRDCLSVDNRTPLVRPAWGLECSV
jgi:hypothetical protein